MMLSGTELVPVLLVAAAASLGSVRSKETAFVEVVLFESSPNGEYTTFTTDLQGRFSRAGATISAEGEIVQGSNYKETLQIQSSSGCNVSPRLVTPSECA